MAKTNLYENSAKFTLKEFKYKKPSSDVKIAKESVFKASNTIISR